MRYEQSVVESTAVEGESPVHAYISGCTVDLQRVELFGIAALSGW
jgi:hypothetical protein